MSWRSEKSLVRVVGILLLHLIWTGINSEPIQGCCICPVSNRLTIQHYQYMVFKKATTSAWEHFSSHSRFIFESKAESLFIKWSCSLNWRRSSLSVGLELGSNSELIQTNFVNKISTIRAMKSKCFPVCVK